MNIKLEIPSEGSFYGHPLKDYQAFITQVTSDKDDGTTESKTCLFLIGGNCILLLTEETTPLTTITFLSADQTIEEIVGQADWSYGIFVKALKSEDFSLTAVVDYDWLKMLDTLDDSVDNIIKDLQAIDSEVNYSDCLTKLNELKTITIEIIGQKSSILDKVTSSEDKEQTTASANALAESITDIDNQVPDIEDEAEGSAPETQSENLPDVDLLLEAISNSITIAKEFKTIVNDAANSPIFEIEEEEIEEEIPEDEENEDEIIPPDYGEN